MQRIIVILFILFVTLWACRKSDGIPTEKLYSSYELFYDQDANITYASAWFIYDGKNMKLGSKNRITFNGTDLKYIESGSYYQVQFSGLISSGRFKWSDSKKALNNDIDLRPVAFRDVIDSLPYSFIDTIFFTGTALAENEYIRLTVDGMHLDDEKIFYETNPGYTGIIADMNIVSSGSNRFILERIYNPVLDQHSGAGGNIQSRYKPREMKVIVY